MHCCAAVMPYVVRERLGQKSIVTLHGQHHQQMRKTITPHFTPKAVAAYTPRLVEVAQQVCAELADAMEPKGEDGMKKFAFKVGRSACINLLTWLSDMLSAFTRRLLVLLLSADAPATSYSTNPVALDELPFKQISAATCHRLVTTSRVIPIFSDHHCLTVPLNTVLLLFICRTWHFAHAACLSYTVSMTSMSQYPTQVLAQVAHLSAPVSVY